jgi:hypothetical protein
MKNLRSLSLAAILAMGVSSTAALAQPYQHPPGPPPGPGYYHPPGHPPGPPPGGPGYHQWHRGDYYHGDRYAVNNWSHYHLRPPPPGYQWVQSGGQFVMIAVATGVVADIIINSQ